LSYFIKGPENRYPSFCNSKYFGKEIINSSDLHLNRHFGSNVYDKTGNKKNNSRKFSLFFKTKIEKIVNKTFIDDNRTEDIKRRYEDQHKLIRESLSKAFPKKGKKGWFEETLGTEGITSGLRGYYTIGEKIGDGEDWSIMNYFDTK
jgi:hypothetical protein